MSNRVIFRYEKLADLCYYCGPLDHLEKDCKNILPDGKWYYGPWLRANGQHPTSLEYISKELDRLNSDLSFHNQNTTPKTPMDKSITLNGGRIVSLVPFANLSDSPSTPNSSKNRAS